MNPPIYYLNASFLFKLFSIFLSYACPLGTRYKNCTCFCPDFTEQEKRDFYEQNRDLFGRYHGDYFTYEEVSQIIEKRLREDAYDKLICDILCESENRQ